MDLLTKKGGALERVCSAAGGFKESKGHFYTFKDTSTGTVARFVEWAYSEDYSPKLRVEYSNEDFSDQAGSTKVLEISSDVERIAKRAREAVARDNHPLLSHARMYVFSDAYLIEDLKSLSFHKLTNQLQSIANNEGLDLNVAVISLLDHCFSNLHPDDELLDFLGQYAAYRITTLRTMPEFIDIMPKVGRAILPYVSACGWPPWSNRLYDPSKKLPHYTGA